MHSKNQIKRTLKNPITLFLSISLVIIVLIIAIWWQEVNNDYSKGNLELKISIDKNVITTTEKFNISITMKNLGNNKVRILNYYPIISIIIKNSSGNMMCRSTEYSMGDFFGADDKDLIILYPQQENKFIIHDVMIYENWSIVNNTVKKMPAKPDIYTIKVIYNASDEYFTRQITLPFYKGQLESNNVSLKMVSDKV